MMSSLPYGGQQTCAALAEALMVITGCWVSGWPDGCSGAPCSAESPAAAAVPLPSCLRCAAFARLGWSRCCCCGRCALLRLLPCSAVHSSPEEGSSADRL